MADTQPPQCLPGPQPPQGPTARPTRVAAAVWIQFALAGVLAAAGTAGLAVSGTVREGTARRLENDSVMGDAWNGFFDAFFGAAFVLEGVAWLLWAAAHAVLGILNGRGRQAVRILSWIQSGLSLTYCGLGSLSGQIGFHYSLNDNGMDRSDELADAIALSTPRWVSAIEFAALIVLIAGSLAVILLLVGGDSDDFFRRRSRRSHPQFRYQYQYQYMYLPQQYPGPYPHGGPPQAPTDPRRPPGRQ